VQPLRKEFQWRVFSYKGVENMWLLEVHEKGLHILGGCLNIWLQGFRPFFLFSLRLIPTVSCLPIIPQKPLFTGGDFFLPFLMIGDMY